LTTPSRPRTPYPLSPTSTANPSHTQRERHPLSHSPRPPRTRTAGSTHARQALHVSTLRCIGLLCDTP
jgi:hypothetical protein